MNNSTDTNSMNTTIKDTIIKDTIIKDTIIKDIVVEINDFLIIANMMHAFIYLSQNGGINIMLKSVGMDQKFIVRKFFKAIQGVKPFADYDNKYYYGDLTIPPIVVDHLLDNDTDVVFSSFIFLS